MTCDVGFILSNYTLKLPKSRSDFWPANNSSSNLFEHFLTYALQGLVFLFNLTDCGKIIHPALGNITCSQIVVSLPQYADSVICLSFQKETPQGQNPNFSARLDGFPQLSLEIYTTYRNPLFSLIIHSNHFRKQGKSDNETSRQTTKIFTFDRAIILIISAFKLLVRVRHFYQLCARTCELRQPVWFRFVTICMISNYMN